MYRLFCIKFIFIFFLGGCAGLYQGYDAIWNAKRHMNEARELENSRDFHGAMIEYVYVAKNFPASNFYKTAIFKAAILSGRSDNPKRNLSTSLYWLNQYLELPLSEQEKESIQFLITLIKKDKQYQDRIAQLQKKLQNQRTLISQNNIEIAVYEKLSEKQKRQIHLLQNRVSSYEEKIEKWDKQIRHLQDEILKQQEALQRLKEIDVRIHKRRLK